MLRAVRLMILAWLLLTGAAAAAQTPETRVALVMGNGAYAGVSALPNPLRDAAAVAEVLREVGFSVQVERDLTYDAMRRVLRDFAIRAEGADWAVVYYAGHGIEVSRANYLVPVDARLKTDKDVSFETMPLEQVLKSVEGAKKLRLIILDACRDNPFVQQMARTVASRSIGRGLARVEPEGGTLVAYAAKEGQIAFDGGGANSPFVTALAKYIRTPGLDIRRVFGRVRDDVLAATNRMQEPYVYGSLGGDEYLFTPAVYTAPARPEVAPAAIVPPSPPPPTGANRNLCVGTEDECPLEGRRPQQPAAREQKPVANVAPAAVPAPALKIAPAPKPVAEPAPKPKPAVRAERPPRKEPARPAPREARSPAPARSSCFVVDGRSYCE